MVRDLVLGYIVTDNPKKHCISKDINNAYEAKNQENFSLSSYFFEK